jgi:hypothetical protein
LEAGVVAQGGDFRVDVEAETGGHSAGLGHHKHRFGQGVAIALFEGPQLFGAHVQAFGLILPADALGLARLLEALAQALQFWDQLSTHG